MKKSKFWKSVPTQTHFLPDSYLIFSLINRNSCAAITFLLFKVLPDYFSHVHITVALRLWSSLITFLQYTAALRVKSHLITFLLYTVALRKKSRIITFLLYILALRVKSCLITFLMQTVALR